MPSSLQIGAVAKRTGLSVDAIRFYERRRLLIAPVRSSGGYRLFGEQEIETLQFLRGAQDLGFSLAEIRDLIELRRGASKPCAQVEQLLERKLAAVHGRIQRLEMLETELSKALRECRRTLRRSRAAGPERCPVLDQISEARRRARIK